MTATAQQAPALRWSSVRDCPRKAVYEATGAPARERSVQEERRLYRGRTLGRDLAEMLAAAQGCIPVKYGEDGWETARFVTEYQVRWPLGVGHMDVFARDTGSAIEVLSSASASESMIHSKLVQLVGYVEHCADATGPAALVILNPSDYSEERILVAQGTARWAELIDEVNDRIIQVEQWAADGTMPLRVCSKPSESIGRFCLHAGHCFESWESPALSQVDDPAALELAVRLYQAKRQEHEVKATLKTVEQERKTVEQELAEILDPGTYELGSVKLTRTHVQRKPTFEFDKAELAGAVSKEVLHEFFKPGAEYDTWRTDRISDAPLVDADDCGDVPF